MQIFLDTSSLLDLHRKWTETHFLISSITLTELESIKTSGTKDEEIKWSARRVLHWLDKNQDKYDIIIHNNTTAEDIIKQFGLMPNNDSRIIAAAYLYNNSIEPILFATNDLACKAIAESIGLTVTYDNSDEEEYTGYKLIEMNDEELANFYINQQENQNSYGLLENQYIIIKSKDENKIIDKYKWAGGEYHTIPFLKEESIYLGKFVPKNGDIYQQLALDSLNSNQITVMRGPAGSGKSLAAMARLMSLLEKNKIDKIIIFCNTVPVRGAARLGFYPGSRNEKLLDSQIGNFLASKLGGIEAVEKMIADNKLVLLPCADIRGLDTGGMRAGVFVTEAQNFSRDMMKLILQRIGEDSIVIIEGDDRTQVDMAEYAGENNGLRALSKAFRGHKCYGEVTLVNIHRSEIAKIAENM